MSRETGRKSLRLLDERVEARRSDPDMGGDENPYWSEEEAQPHPAPEQGCIRRGLCCKSSPGWFAPGEVEAAAEVLGLTPSELVARYVVIDAIELDGQTVEVFVPVKRGRDGEPLIQPGTRVDRLYRLFRSPCIFFDGAGCQIYAARPAECRAYLCTQPAELNLSHEAIARRWRGEQE